MYAEVEFERESMVRVIFVKRVKKKGRG